jgi:hypothetical protein
MSFFERQEIADFRGVSVSGFSRSQQFPYPMGRPLLIVMGDDIPPPTSTSSEMRCPLDNETMLDDVGCASLRIAEENTHRGSSR